MKIGSPKKNATVSWMILIAGALLAVIGASTMRDYEMNLWLLLGFATIIGGIVYHLIAVRCPYCGHSLAGYRPLPEQCPVCHKPFAQ